MRLANFRSVLFLLVLALPGAGCRSSSDQPPPQDQGEPLRWSGDPDANAGRDREMDAMRQRIVQLETKLASGPSSGSMVVPGGQVSVSIQGPREASPGMEIPYQVLVENHSPQRAVDIEVKAQISPRLTIVDDGGGDWTASNRTIRWQIPGLEGGASQTLTFTGKATGTGAIEHCVDVSHRIAACVATQIVQAALACQLRGPEVVEAPGSFPVLLAVTNTGSGTARNVRGQVQVTGNLKIAAGSSAIDFGEIPAGQRVERQITVQAEKGGPYDVALSVSGEGGVSTRCEVSGDVVQPGLAITKTGPKARHQGQPIEYRIVVRSTGSGLARGVVVRDRLPRGTEFVSATRGGTFTGGEVVWQLGDLAQGKQEELGLVLRATVEGTIRNCATVEGAGLPPREACADTEVLFVPAMHISALDTEDPVEIGDTTTYVIEVRNEGQKATTQVELRVQIPEESEFVSAECALADGTWQSGERTAVFRKIPRMDPGQRVEYRVTVRFTERGSAVCGAILSYAEFGKPVRAEEGTTSYE